MFAYMVVAALMFTVVTLVAAHETLVLLLNHQEQGNTTYTITVIVGLIATGFSALAAWGFYLASQL